MKQNEKVIIYTDLDGTFLDEKNYSNLESLPALRVAQQSGVPVIFCSSKTRAEIEHLRKAAGVNIMEKSKTKNYALSIRAERICLEVIVDSWDNIVAGGHSVLPERLRRLRIEQLARPPELMLIGLICWRTSLNDSDGLNGIARYLRNRYYYANLKHQGVILHEILPP